MKNSCSHGGHKTGEAMSHLKKMHKEHGHPDHQRVHGHAAASGERAENENRENPGMERSMERDEREDG